MGISICVYNHDVCDCDKLGDDCPCLDDEIWQSSYSTFSKVFKDVKLPAGNECWSYLECHDLAQRLKNYFPDHAEDYRINNFIIGLERAYETKLNVIIC